MIPAHCTIRPAQDAKTKHFALSEFHSRDGVEVPVNLRGNVQMLMEQLEVIRAAINKPITITSGYRSVAHNKKVGGVESSLHLCAMAGDLKVKGMTSLELYMVIRDIAENGRIKNGGLGLYDTFVHYDIGRYRRWDYRKKRN